MKTTIVCLAAIVNVVVPFFLICAAEPSIQWVRQLDEAKRIAAAQNKDLLINFTGLSWCQPCNRLDRDVFRKSEFEPAAKDFVLVELDFPGLDELLDENLKASYIQWRTQYLVRSFPTVVVADATGTPYAFTGYLKGDDPLSVIKRLDSYRAARRVRDGALAEAANLIGVDRAKKLDAALRAILPFLGSISARDADPMVAFYGKLVEEICLIDTSDSAELRSYYEARIAKRKEWDESKAAYVEKELKRFKPLIDSPAAVEFIEQLLSEIDDVDLRWRLEIARQTHMEWAGAPTKDPRMQRTEDARKEWLEAALANAKRLQSVPDRTAQDRKTLLQKEAVILQWLDRIDEMIVVFDQQISEAGDSKERLSLLQRKATSLVRQPTRHIPALREWQAATEQGSHDWADVTQRLAIALSHNHEYAEAVRLQQQLLHLTPNSADLLLDLADSERGLGLLADARETLAKAEKLSEPLLSNPAERNRDRLQQSILKSRIAKLRELLGQSN